MLTDSRLHVNVRPCLEYRIPQVCLAVRDTILGDRNKTDALNACDECFHDLKIETIPPLDTKEDTSNPVYNELQHYCTQVCSQVDEYLRHLVATWRAYLDPIVSTIIRTTMQLNSEFDTAARVSKLYHNPGTHMLVSRELRAEKKRIANELQKTLVEMRARNIPKVQRPDALVNASEQLRNRFAEAYGKLPTTTILLIKQHFEAQLICIQHDIATNFVQRMTECIGSPAM